jgi:phosphoglycerate dehydrogenase-like enzyme
MKFNKICIIDINELQLCSTDELWQYSELPPIFIDEIPKSVEAMIELMKDVDCLLASVSTCIPEMVFNNCPNLKYVGIFARALSRIDVDAAQKNCVVVRNINNWCDWETAEFVIASILHVFRSLGNKQWIEAPQCLKGKQLGIIGLGEVGFQVAVFAKSFGMKVTYHNRTEKKDIKELGYDYMMLKELMRTSDVISLHVPPDSRVLGKTELEITSDKTVLVNTSVGDIIDQVHLKNWLNNKSHFAIFDKIAGDEIESLKDLSNVYITDVDAYLTPGVKERRIKRLLDNIKIYLVHDKK